MGHFAGAHFSSAAGEAHSAIVGSRGGGGARAMDRCIGNDHVRRRPGDLLPVPFSGTGRQLSTPEAKMAVRGSWHFAVLRSPSGLPCRSIK